MSLFPPRHKKGTSPRSCRPLFPPFSVESCAAVFPFPVGCGTLNTRDPSRPLPARRNEKSGKLWSLFLKHYGRLASLLGKEAKGSRKEASGSLLFLLLFAGLHFGKLLTSTEREQPLPPPPSTLSSFPLRLADGDQAEDHDFFRNRRP